MKRTRATCPTCSQKISLPGSAAAAAICCPNCQSSFRVSQASVRGEGGEQSAEKESDAAESVIVVDCSKCCKRFGVNCKSIGAVVACPHCQTNQQAVAANQPANSQLVRSPPAKNETGSATKNGWSIDEVKADPNEIDSQVHTSLGVQTNASSEDGNRQLLTGLLPPKFLIQDEETKTVRRRETGNVFGIDTDLTRIHLPDSAVPVRSLSRDEKDRRKRVRVAIVSSLGILVLILLFYYLNSTSN